MHKLLGYVCEELEDLERKVDKSGKLSMTEVQYLDLLAHTKKSLLTAKAMEESGYSNDGYSGARRRDTMGRYMDSGPNNGSYAMNGGSYSRYNDGGSMDGGYSNRRYSRDEGKSYMISQLQNLMQNANSQQEREVMQQAMDRLQQM